MALTKLQLRPEQSTYVFNPAEDVVSVTVEGGASRSRRTVIGSHAIIDCTWTLNFADYQYLRAFYHSVGKQGSAPFLIDLLLDQPYLEEFEAKFVPDTFEMSEPIGLSFKQSAQLEVKPKNDTDYYDAIVLLYGDDLFLNQLEQLANYDLEVA